MGAAFLVSLKVAKCKRFYSEMNKISKGGCQKREIRYKERIEPFWPLCLTGSKIFLIIYCRLMYLPWLEICFFIILQAFMYHKWIFFISRKNVSFSSQLNVCRYSQRGLSPLEFSLKGAYVHVNMLGNIHINICSKALT